MRLRKDRGDSKERYSFIEGAFMELTRNWSLEKFSRIHEEKPSYDLKQ